VKKVKIAQIGVAHDHSNTFRTMKALTELFDIAGYHIPECEKGRFEEKMVFFEGYPELALEQILEDPEITAVSIETEEENLTKYAILAAKAGKHIHMDKPGGFSLADFEKLVEITRSKNLILHLGYMYRYNPVISKVIQRVKDGEFGEIISVDAQMNNYLSPRKRQWLEKLPGGMTFYLTCHLIDLILQIQGMPLDITSFSGATGLDGVTARDFSMLVFRYPKGASVAKACCAEHGGFERRQLVISGSKGDVEIKPLEYRPPEGGEYTDATEYWPKTAQEPIVSYRSERFYRYRPMMESFGKMIAGEIENPYGYDYELCLYKLILKCCE